MALKLCVVVQPSKEVLSKALSVANAYTRKNYRKTSRYIRYTYSDQTVFRVPHITLRGSCLVETSDIPDFLKKVEMIARKHKPFKIVLSGTQSFVNKGKPTVYYWFVKPTNVLKKIHEELRVTLDKQWSAKYHEHYNPHLTLVVDETSQSPFKYSKPAQMPKVSSKVDKITILYRHPNKKTVTYQKVYKKIKLG